MNSTATMKLAVPLFGLLMSACASNPTTTEREFGDSVRQMVRAQTFDQSTLSNPSEATIESTEGRMLEAVLEVYRTTVADPASVGNEITINVGNGQ